MERPILSICIPTYNRARYLPECLSSIVSQLEVKEMGDNVEIVIADNASTDNTEDIVKEYQKLHANIIYFRNEKNIGFDRSFARLLERSTGIYCLSLGDDDALFPGALNHILAKIKEMPDVPFFGLNCWGYDVDLKNAILPYPNLRITKDHRYGTLAHYVRSIKEYTNLVGVFVGLSTQLFKRDPWVAYIGKEKFFDTLAIHMYVNLSIYKDFPFALIALPIVKTRSSNIRWDVFEGLGTITGRIKGTITTVTWIKNHFRLPISKTTINIYFYTREYWFTGKEVLKRMLQRMGLLKVIIYYRTLRALLYKQP